MYSTLHRIEHELKLTESSSIVNILSNHTFFVVVLLHQIHIYTYDLRHLVLQQTIATFAHQPAHVTRGIVALSSRWLAYCPQTLEYQYPKTPTPGPQDNIPPFIQARMNHHRCSGHNNASESDESSYSISELAQGVASGLYYLGKLGRQTMKTVVHDDHASEQSSKVSTSFPASEHPKTIGTVESSAGAVVVLDLVSGQRIAAFTSYARTEISYLTFDPTGLLLVIAPVHGQTLHIHRLMPDTSAPSSSSSSSSSNQRLLYKVHRGLTHAQIINICFSVDSQWMAITTLRGTTHVFALQPEGGPVDLESHCGVSSSSLAFASSSSFDSSRRGSGSPQFNTHHDHNSEAMMMMMIQQQALLPRYLDARNRNRLVTISALYRIRQPLSSTMNDSIHTSDTATRETIVDAALAGHFMDDGTFFITTCGSLSQFCISARVSDVRAKTGVFYSSSGSASNSLLSSAANSLSSSFSASGNSPALGLASPEYDDQSFASSSTNSKPSMDLRLDGQRRWDMRRRLDWSQVRPTDPWFSSDDHDRDCPRRLVESVVEIERIERQTFEATQMALWAHPRVTFCIDHENVEERQSHDLSSSGIIEDVLLYDPEGKSRTRLEVKRLGPVVNHEPFKQPPDDHLSSKVLVAIESKTPFESKDPDLHHESSTGIAVQEEYFTFEPKRSVLPELQAPAAAISIHHQNVNTIHHHHPSLADVNDEPSQKISLKESVEEEEESTTAVPIRTVDTTNTVVESTLSSSSSSKSSKRSRRRQRKSQHNVPTEVAPVNICDSM